MIDSIPPSEQAARREGKHTVLLTDFINNAGIYLLQDLLKSPDISHVYCLAPNTRYLSGHKGIALSLEAKKVTNSPYVTVLNADLAQEIWNLPLHTYHNLQHQITLIIHNAWVTNFNWSLASFQPQILGTINIIRFCASAMSMLRLFWTTLRGPALGYHHSTDSIPRDPREMNATTINGHAWPSI